MLAGRKLLLADDSVTIQKVIDLTFADEGVTVVAFSNGQDAIDHLEEIAPDIVLADVFMPNKSGYEVCEYVKNNEKLKRTPVMLLVGSFEPFDEAEARRVGANDILTKPFQSIRRLIDRVGALVNNPPVEKEVGTAELPKTTEFQVGEALLDTHELELTTADTRPFAATDQLALQESEIPVLVSSQAVVEEQMEPAVNGVHGEPVESSDALLDLDDYDTIQATVADDFELELDLDEAPQHVQATGRLFVEPQVTETVASVAAHNFSHQPPLLNDSFEDTQEIAYERVYDLESEAVSVVAAEPQASSAPVDVNSLPQSVIDQIARRAVEMLSEKIVQDIAWEVVPDLAELMIRRQLEERESQTK